jgi:hypothetical protein
LRFLFTLSPLVQFPAYGKNSSSDANTHWDRPTVTPELPPKHDVPDDGSNRDKDAYVLEGF